MKRRAIPWLLTALLLAAPVRGEDTPSKEAPQEPKLTGRFEESNGRRVLSLWGTPHQRGFAHGYLMAERILAGITHDFEKVMRPFLPLYQSVVKNLVVPRFAFTEREQEELEGLFEGIRARLPEEKLFLPALGRKVELVDIKALNTFGDWYGLGCSSLAVWGELSADGRPLVGRNFDFPAFDLVLAHQCVVVRAADGGLRGQVGVTYPGCIGVLTGMNADGVFVSIHDVRVKPSLDKAMRPNVPRLLATRRLLEQLSGEHTCRRAQEILAQWPTLYGNNLMVVAPEVTEGEPTAAVYEYDGRRDLDGGLTMRLGDAKAEAEAGAVWLCCTNHHRVRAEPANYDDPRPRWRYEVLSSIAGKNKPPKGMTPEVMFSWMSLASFPREGAPQKRAETLRGKARHHGTLHQAVGEPAARRLHVRLGKVGKNIADVEPQTFDVTQALSRAGPR